MRTRIGRALHEIRKGEGGTAVLLDDEGADGERVECCASAATILANKLVLLVPKCDSGGKFYGTFYVGPWEV